MKEVTVVNSEKIALVDDEDFELCSQYTWRVYYQYNSPDKPSCPCAALSQMKQISLTNSDKFALVDDEDYWWLMQYKWHVIKSGRKEQTKYYVATRSVDGSLHLMHRMIMKAERNQEIDHINVDTFDNQKLNLRFVTRQQNNANSQKQLMYGGRNTSSKYKGVCYDKERDKWRSQIIVNYKQINLGRFPDEESAARTYDEAARKHFGKFARTNF